MVSPLVNAETINQMLALSPVDDGLNIVFGVGDTLSTHYTLEHLISLSLTRVVHDSGAID